MTEKVKILIVEDELIIAESLKEVLENLGYAVTGIAMSANKALELIDEVEPDLAILDIQLKGKEDGIWLAGQISDHFKFPYIFLTSHGDDKTVREAVKKHPYGYLLKPFEKLDIFTAIECALSSASNKREGEAVNELFSEFLFVKDDHSFIKVRFSDVLFLKASGNYVEIHTVVKKILVRTSMKDIFQKFPQDKFLQVHRSYTVNLEKVEAFGANNITVGKEELPLSSIYRNEIMKRFQTH